MKKKYDFNEKNDFSELETGTSIRAHAIKYLLAENKKMRSELDAWRCFGATRGIAMLTDDMRDFSD